MKASAIPPIALSALLLGLASCASTSTDAASNAGDTVTAERSSYVRAAAASDLFEIRSSQLALSKSQRPEVRDFAGMLVTHHTEMTERLWTAARASGMVRTHEWMLPPPMQSMLEELQQASADDFDGVYIRQQVQAHESALTLHRSYAETGDAAALRQVAAAAVPVVQQHLDRARLLR